MRLSRRLPLVFLVSCLMECEGEVACWRAKQVEGRTQGLEEMPDKVPFVGFGSPETWLVEQLPRSVWAGFVTRVCCWKQHVLNTMGLGREAVCVSGTSCPVSLGPTPRSCAYGRLSLQCPSWTPHWALLGFQVKGQCIIPVSVLVQFSREGQ